MSKSLHHQIAARARKIIADSAHWVQGQLAVIKVHRSVDPSDVRAHRFCVDGALRRAADDVAQGEHDIAARVQVALEHFVHVRHPQLDNYLENLNDDSDDATVL